jgi:hypothetical protein
MRVTHKVGLPVELEREIFELAASTDVKCPWPPPLRLPKKEGAIKQRMDEPCGLLGLSIGIYAL